MTKLQRPDALDGLEVAARHGGAASKARLYCAVRPLAVRRARVELEPHAAELVADAVCRSVVNSVPGRAASDGSLVRLVHSTTRRLIDRTESKSRIGLPAEIEALPERLREVLIMRLIVGLDVDDTAVVLGRTRAQVLVEQHRALAMLCAVAAAAAS
ncbi:sigma factor-like helix-turn-helix DNA-binding protein [Rhodococcus sp. IEGM 1366]|uniref:sigma factor-like helix-turn-helix DNA-binding protein n=1 Tax=Rhodococcus sp. IEGM 1366 TaxID=3082223 RepID=UPI0029531141|nr:sigma factor-like helix-turn-helix DNA-binding protein [Rhodococcus sp. IEGM 1366]MDV8069174.1 sigma factor-like helix-turn-helix DNA-binding protein [Rhodococcus sp. IEGM 1366]